MRKKMGLMLIFLAGFFLCTLQQVYAREGTDLIFLMDGSGSMYGSPFDTEKEGLAKAIEDPNIIPRDGSVSVTVIQFSGYGAQKVEVPPTIITSQAVADQVAATIRNIVMISGLTYFADAINLGVSTIMNWQEHGTRQAINLITDGGNFDISETLAASDNAMSAGIDIINAIGVGLGVDIDNLWDIVQPHYPGYPDSAQRPTSSSTDYGYVWSLTTWQEFLPVVAEKIAGEIIPPLPPVEVPETTEGLLLYVKDIYRQNREITRTGNLYIKNTQSKSETQLTGYSGIYIIRNPSFSSNGKEVIYTSNIGGLWQIYIISKDRFVGNASQGVVINNGNNHPYAALSPDDRHIVYVEEDSNGNTRLFSYNRISLTKGIVCNVRDLVIKDVEFINNGLVSFIGVYNGIQDIYTVGLDGTNLTNLTNNVPLTPRYGRIKSAWRYGARYIIYTKAIFQGLEYGKQDIFRLDIDNLDEKNLTNTPELDEYDPVYRSIYDEKQGFMFYSANVMGIPLLNSADVWSAYYNSDDISNTNIALTFWTGSFTTTEYAGQIDFISASALIPEAGRVINVQDTRIVYTAGGNKVIYRSDNDGTNWNNPGTAISTISVDKFVSDMDSTGGKIIYGFDSVPQTLIRANHDGSGEVTFAQGTSAGNEIKDACWSPDGRWVVFVKREKINKYGIYAKMANQDTAQVDTPLLTDISSTDVQHPSFSPDGTMLVFSKRDIGGTYDIYTLGIKTDDGTSIYPGTLKQITYTPAISEMQPSYSPDGKKIIFLSDNPAGINQIYTTDTNGSSRELVVEGGQNLNINYPLFGDVNVETNIYYIGYVSDNPASGTRTIKIARLPKIDPTPGDGENLATLYQDTGLEPTNDKFIWGIKREKGTIVAQRNLSKRTAKNQDFQYSVVIDVDETIMLNGYTLEEIITADFLTSDIFVSIDGSAFSAPVVYDDSPSQGYRTIKIAFSPFQNGGVKDHTVRIKMKAPNSTGIQPIEGDIKYMIDGIANTAVISGNSSISISSPFIPVDVYTLENEEGSDGIIGDWDLLYAIDAWTNSRQLSGFGIKWPEDIGNWDGILLALIDIWASPAGTKGTHTGGSASTASSVPGEYQYIGLYVYTPPAVGKSEMYWTQGKWLE